MRVFTQVEAWMETLKYGMECRIGALRRLREHTMVHQFVVFDLREMERYFTFNGTSAISPDLFKFSVLL